MEGRFMTIVKVVLCLSSQRKAVRSGLGTDSVAINMWQVFFFFHFHSFLIFYLLNDNYSFLGVFDDSRYHRTHGFFEFTNHLVHSFNFPILPFAINSFTVSCVIYYFLPLILEYMKDKNKQTGNKRSPKLLVLIRNASKA